jgi:hypothetical protein
MIFIYNANSKKKERGKKETLFTYTIKISIEYKFYTV